MLRRHGYFVEHFLHPPIGINHPYLIMFRERKSFQIELPANIKQGGLPFLFSVVTNKESPVWILLGNQI